MRIILLLLLLLSFNVFSKEQCYEVDGMVCKVCVKKIELAHKEATRLKEYFDIKSIEPGKLCLKILKKPEKTQKILSLLLKKAGEQYSLVGLVE